MQGLALLFLVFEDLCGIAARPHTRLPFPATSLRLVSERGSNSRTAPVSRLTVCLPVHGGGSWFDPVSAFGLGGFGVWGVAVGFGQRLFEWVWFGFLG